MKQKVFLVFEKDGYDGECIAGVFFTREAAEKAIKYWRTFDRIEEFEVIEDIDENRKPLYKEFPAPLLRTVYDIRSGI